jgi:hypothetical protein
MQIVGCTIALQTHAGLTIGRDYGNYVCEAVWGVETLHWD